MFSNENVYRCLQHGHPLPRAWRDVAAINHHIGLNFDAVMSMYGQFVFGLIEGDASRR
jgi:hypothetical protein